MNEGNTSLSLLVCIPGRYEHSGRVGDNLFVGNKEHNYIVRMKDGARPNDVLVYLLQHGIEIHSFNEILPSLNDIFIKLVEGTPLTRQFQNVTA